MSPSPATRPPCSLSILVARTDVAFMRQTIPHLVRSCAYPFRERALVIDTAPLGAAYASRPGIGSAEDLRRACEALVAEGWIDRLHYIDYGRARRDEVNRRYFGRALRETHDFRGYPVYGSLLALDLAPTDLVVHFDSDMLLHQAKDFSWIAAAADLLQRRPDVLFAAPRSGPPRADHELHQGSTRYQHEAAEGFYRFEFFTSRKFLVSRERLRQAAPVPPLWTSRKKRALGFFTGRSALWSFEMMASEWMKQTKRWRGDLDHPGAWTLHTPDHGPAFLAALGEVIARVEAGAFPPAQAGHYDLDLKLWAPR